MTADTPLSSHRTAADPVRIGFVEKACWLVLGILPATCLLFAAGVASAAIVHAGASGGCGGG